MAQGVKRFRFLDGLRGWAAFSVLIYHIFIDGLPPNSFMADRAQWSKAFLLNGTLAVCIFFVVSGFSLSIRYLETGEARGLARIAAGRYLRLAIPIFAICAIAYLLMMSGAIGPAYSRPVPLDNYLTFMPSLQSLFGFGLFKVFFAYSSAETYDPPLWTMSYEFFGSLMVFIILAALRGWHARTVLFAALFLTLTLWQGFFALFVGGILIADLFAKLSDAPSSKRYGAALCLCGMILGLSLAAWFNAVYIAVAMLLVAGVAFCGPIRALFENRLSDFLGWMSYPLYLVQAPVVYAFSVNALRYLTGYGIADEPARWMVGAATVPVAILCAIAFCPVNDLAVKLSRKFGASFVGLFDRAVQRLA
ncbi:MAG: acyltransferase family protein [Pseudolabrys sp.]